MKSAEQKSRIGNGSAKEDKESPLSAAWTTPPGHYVVLYDGFCNFCVAGANKMKVLARPGAIELMSFQEPGALDRFPGVTRNACMLQMHLITPEGKVVGGLEAAVQAVATRPIMRFLVYTYYLPGVRFLGNRI